MPLTPFHLGPALLIGVILHRRLDLPTLLAASVVVDVRAALVLFGPLDPPIHGILTTFAGGTVVALLLAGVITGFGERLRPLLAPLRLADTDAAGPVVAAALVGVYSHVLLDAKLYTDARPFFPLEVNPFYVGATAFLPVYAGCALAGLLALPIAVVRWRGH
ncbi:hypothetical protein OB920_12700 [Halobacteria archaeon HArc-gm2]|nr:hypothetical protein [Halobacteria archaeon HArc-gm2]